MKHSAVLLVFLVVLGSYTWSIGALAQAPQESGVEAIEAVGMTVADMERSVGFYSSVLSFVKVSDVEVVGSAYEQLEGVFGLRMRVVRMRLGEEFIELIEFLAPRGLCTISPLLGRVIVQEGILHNKSFLAPARWLIGIHSALLFRLRGPAHQVDLLG